VLYLDLDHGLNGFSSDAVENFELPKESLDRIGLADEFNSRL